jgi:hypothetical protein
VAQWPEQEFSSDSESWVPCTGTLLRSLTEEEARRWKGEGEAAEARGKALRRLKSPLSYEPKWERPEACDCSEIESGREKHTFAEDSIPYGGGWWVFVGPGDAWIVNNNGRDGDDWSLNNCRTWGAGAVAFRTRDPNQIAEVKQLLALVST